MKYLFVLFAAIAFTANAATLGELGDKYSELEKAELDSKIGKAKADTGNPLAKPGAASAAIVGAEKASGSQREQDSLALNGVFGVGNDLKADLSINNVSVVMREGDVALGWKVVSIGKYEVSVAKVGGKKNSIGRTVQLRLLGASEPPAAMPTGVPVGTPMAPPPPNMMPGRVMP